MVPPADVLAAKTVDLLRGKDQAPGRAACAPIAVDPERAGRLVSRGTVPGAVQIVPGGQPIVLFVDGPTTGGYPIGGVVATADLPLIGQLGPGDPVQFAATTIDDARAALASQQRLIDLAMRSIWALATLTDQRTMGVCIGYAPSFNVVRARGELLELRHGERGRAQVLQRVRHTIGRGMCRLWCLEQRRCEVLR